MATFVITGASRGIGLELVRQLLALSPSHVSKVFALSRSEPSDEFVELIAQHPDRVVHVSAAVDDTQSVQQAALKVQSILGNQGLDVLVNNAGVTAFSPGGVKTCTPEQLASVFDVNVIGVQRVTAAFLPLLEAGRQKKVVTVSSTLGSVSWAHKFKLAPAPAYKISKAAVHMLNAQYALAYEEAGFTFLCVSPGWLKTDLGGEGADLPVEVGVAELRRIIFETDSTQNGKFLNIHVPGMEDSWGKYDGKEVDW